MAEKRDIAGIGLLLTIGLIFLINSASQEASKSYEEYNDTDADKIVLEAFADYGGEVSTGKVYSTLNMSQEQFEDSATRLSNRRMIYCETIPPFTWCELTAKGKKEVQ